MHQLAGYPAIAESPFVRIVLDGLQRNLAKPKVRKEPVTADMLSALVASLGEVPSLTEVRLVAACLLGFSAFLRYDEIAKLRCCDVTFGPQNMVINILSSKTDQYRQGDRVLVARTASLHALWQCWSVITSWPLFPHSQSFDCLEELLL